MLRVDSLERALLVQVLSRMLAYDDARLRRLAQMIIEELAKAMPGSRGQNVK